jgi:hypothetical protein
MEDRMFDRSRSRQAPPDPVTPRLMFRQGDVLLVAVDALPEQARLEPRTGRIVLAEGEVTGHAHAIEEHDALTYTYQGERYLLTRSTAQLIHEEHAPIAVPPGAWRVVIQREYAPEAGTYRPWRTVAD